jgi:hypothetical protein
MWTRLAQDAVRWSSSCSGLRKWSEFSEHLSSYELLKNLQYEIIYGVTLITNLAANRSNNGCRNACNITYLIRSSCTLRCRGCSFFLF